MTIFTHTQNSFLNGELAQSYTSRADLAAHSNGVSVLQNAHTTESGAIKRRGGLKLVHKLPQKGKLFSFTLKSNDNYLIVLLPGLMYLYKDDALFDILETPYKESEIDQIQTSQNLSEMIFTHQNHHPKVLTYEKTYGFVFKNFVFAQDTYGTSLYPYYKFDDKKSVLFTPAGITGATTITSNVDFFTSDMINKEFIFNEGSFKIISIISLVKANIQVLKQFKNIAQGSYKEAAFSDTRGYPKTSCFHQGRLVFGATPTQPNKLWFSKTFTYGNFDCGQGLDDEAIEFCLLSSGMEEIQTIFSALHLQILTYSGEWIVPTNLITPSTVSLSKQTAIGSPTERFLPVLQIESATIFVSKDKKEIREFVYGQVVANYTSNNLSQLCSHLIKDPTDMTYNKSKRQLYVVLSNGEMAVLTVSPQNQVLSWSNYQTYGKFLYSTTLDNNTYVITKRNENFYLEKFEDDLYLDCAKYEHSKEQSITGIYELSEYLGEEIYIKVDDFIYSKKKIEESTMILNEPVSSYCIGYPYKHTIVPFPFTKLSGGGYKKYRLIELSIRLEESAILEIDTGFGLNKLQLEQRSYGKGLTEFTGNYVMSSFGYKTNGNTPLWKIQSDAPFKFCMQSISLKIKALS